MSTFEQQLEKVASGQGFIAALDQSGGSTPKALAAYGVLETAYDSDDDMFAAVHAMRTRIITDAAFTSERVLGAIFFENTLDRKIEGKPSASYLWEEKGIVPFLKVDKGLLPEENGVQLMKPMPALAALLEKAKLQPVFGTKMRSVIKAANNEGIKAIVAQQFDVGLQIAAAGLVPILEPEVDIHSTDKAEIEAILKEQLMAHLNTLEADQKVMLKLTLPEQADFYADCVNHPNVVKVVALSGGYSRDEANRRVSENKGMIASFSRALLDGLLVDQSDEAFNAILEVAVSSIYEASIA